MRKYLLRILIISFVFLLAPTVHVASYAGEIETYSLPNETRYDKLANCFYKAFLENHGKSELAASNFESNAIRLNLTNTHCCDGAVLDE